jgi:hypothetical protein
MSYATIMVYVEADSTPRERVRLSAQLASKFNATLIVVSARAIRPPILVGGIGVAALPDGIPDIEARLAEKAKWLQLVVGAVGQSSRGGRPSTFRWMRSPGKRAAPI